VRSIQSDCCWQHVGQYDADDYYDGELTSVTSTAKPWTPYLPWATATILAGLMAILFAGRQKIAPLRGRMAYVTLVLLVIATAGLVVA